MTTAAPSVTIVVPVLNEEEYVRDCVRCIGAQTYPDTLLDVIFVDGGSTDATRAVLEAEATTLLRSRWRLLVNPKGDRSSSLNLGLAAAVGVILVRIDARSRPRPNYVAGCVDVLERRPDVGVVGGAQLALPRSATARDIGIARALQNRWMTGLSRYRLRRISGPSDTTWLGAFRAGELKALGGWNEEVEINEDYELNERIRRTGALVWFEAALTTGYVPRAGLGLLARQYLAYGQAKGTRWRAGAHWRPRHVLLVAFPPTGALLALLAARRLGLARTAALAISGFAVVEATGGAEVEAGIRGRAVAVAGISTIGGSWWAGVLVGLLRGSPPVAPVPEAR